MHQGIGYGKEGRNDKKEGAVRFQTEALTNKFPKQWNHHSPTPPPITPEQILYGDGQIRKCLVLSSLAHRFTAPEESVPES